MIIITAQFKKIVILSLLIFFKFSLINCMEKYTSQYEEVSSASIETIPQELLNMIIFYLNSVAHQNPIHLAFTLLGATKNLRLTNSSLKETIEELIKLSCSMTSDELELLQEAFRNKFIFYVNEQLSYNFSNINTDQCTQLVKIIYLHYIEHSISEEPRAKCLIRLIDQAHSYHQKEALKYLGTTKLYQELSKATEIGLLSVEVINVSCDL